MVICYNGERGSAPGRSDGKKAWFSMDGKECETDDFAFVSLQGMSSKTCRTYVYRTLFFPRSEARFLLVHAIDV